jgi:hypothetical protein
MYEMGNAYVPEPSDGDTLLAEFGMKAVCHAGNSTKLDVAVFTSRTGILKIRDVGGSERGRRDNSDDKEIHILRAAMTSGTWIESYENKV